MLFYYNERDRFYYLDMKLFIPQEKLAFALNTVGRAVSPNNTLPVLNNILLKAEGKKLFFSATNLEIALSYWVDADVHNEGGITLPAKLFMGYINLLSTRDPLELKLGEGLTLSLKTVNSRTKIKGIGVEEFPLIPKIENPQTFSLSSAVLQEAITQVVFSASPHLSRPILSGILFSYDKDILSLVSTDSFRLSEKRIHLTEKPKQSLHCIIPAKTIIELGKILSTLPSDIEVRISLSQTQVLFEFHNIKLMSRLIEGAFPEYKKIIPSSNKTKVIVNTNEFILAVRQVSLFVVTESNNIKLSVTNDGLLTLSTGETQVGEEVVEIPAKVSGENNQIGLNFQFLLDVLNNITHTSTQIEMDGNLSPISLRPAEKEDYVHIIMPLKV